MPYVVDVDGNTTRITTNIKPMLEWALGKPLESLDNTTGRQAYHDLWPAVAQIYRPDDLDTLTLMEPKNGYGTVDDTRHFLVELLELASNNPNEVFTVCIRSTTPTTSNRG